MAKFLLSAFADEASGKIDGQIKALNRNGFKFIEIRNVDGSCIIDHNITSIKEIKNKLESQNIKVSSIGSPIGKISIEDPFEPHEEAFKRTLEAASILCTKRIRMFSFYIPTSKKAEDYRNEVFERLECLLELSEAAGIYCCLENEKGIYGDSKERSLEIYKTFNNRMRAIFDPANYIQCGEKPIEIFEELYPFVDYLHVKDANYIDGSVVPSGYGDGHIAEIISIFSKAYGERFLSVEPHLTVFEGFDNLRDSSLKHRFTYASCDEAFDAACIALKEILNKGDYDYE
jgi:sugar phosphate isomerase/epimerase